MGFVSDLMTMIESAAATGLGGRGVETSNQRSPPHPSLLSSFFVFFFFSGYFLRPLSRVLPRPRTFRARLCHIIHNTLSSISFLFFWIFFSFIFALPTTTTNTIAGLIIDSNKDIDLCPCVIYNTHTRRNIYIHIY